LCVVAVSRAILSPRIDRYSAGEQRGRHRALAMPPARAAPGSPSAAAAASASAVAVAPSVAVVRDLHIGNAAAVAAAAVKYYPRA